MSVVLLGSTSGSVTLQEPAVAGSTVIDLPATSGTMAVLPTATSVLPQASGGTGTTTGYYGFKNRIINGAMVIAQRVAVATPVTVNASNDYYACDRFSATGQSTDGVFTIQQSTTAPSGFKNSILATVTTADASIGATQYYIPVRQKIEGFNVADLEWGTASAATVTLSFWVRSSLTGTFGGAITNNAQTRSYPFSYTITSANTWEQKSITIAGDTTGTWVTNNGNGMDIVWSIGMGSTYSGTANTWAGAAYFSPTGATNLIGTNGATFYITGVQLEKGSTATSFDYRPYGTELQLAQRYFETYVINNSSSIGNSTSGTAATTILKWYVPKRTTPSLTLPTAGTSTGQLSFLTSVGGFATTVGANTVAEITVDKATILGSGYTGLTSPGACIFYSNGTSTIQISAEL